MSTENKINIKNIKFAVFAFLSLFLIMGLIITAHQWCDFRNIFSLKRVSVSGCFILTEQDVIEEIDPLIKDKNLQSIQLKKVQQELEKKPYIRTANVVKAFPSRLKIHIFERTPLSYLLVNNKNYMIDRKGVLLPVPDNSLNKDLPIISGHSIDSLPAPGDMIRSSEIGNSVNILTDIKSNVPGVYAKFSELHYRKNKNDYLIHLNSKTKIFLGEDNLKKKLNTFIHFTQQLPDDVLLTQYRYLDMRWKQQIVAKEKRT